MKVRIKYDHWLPKWINMGAITLYPFICVCYTKEECPRELLQHEFVHVRDVRSLGWIRFYATYLYYMLKYPYLKIPFEVKAYQLGPITPLTDAEKAEVELL